MKKLSTRASRLVYALSQDEARKTFCSEVLPEHILLTRDNPEFLHQVPSFRIYIEKTGTTCRHWILLLYYIGIHRRLQEAVHRHSTLTCSQSLV